MKPGKIVHASLEGQTLHLEYEQGKAVVDVLRPELVRFWIPQEEHVHSFAVEHDVHAPALVRLRREEAENGLTAVLTTDALKISVGTDFSLEICDADGNVICATDDSPRTPRMKYTPAWAAKMAKMYLAQMNASEERDPENTAGNTHAAKAGGSSGTGKSLSEEENATDSSPSDGGTRSAADTAPADLLSAEGHAAAAFLPRPSAVTMQWKLFGDERFYGLGDKTGFLNKFGYEYDNWNTDDPKAHTEQYHMLYKSIPFLIQLRGAGCCGFFFDNPWRSHFDLGKESSSYFLYDAEDGDLDLYFIWGPAMTDVVSRYTQLTGRQPLPQLWTLGYQQSRWGYDTAEEVRTVADRLRKERIPCDAIHFDIDYMDGYRVFTWDEEAFGAPGEIVRELAGKGFRAVPIIDPGVKKDPGYAVYDEGMERDYFAKTPQGEVYSNQVWPGETVFPDFGKADVRRWWAEKERHLTDLGFAGTWNDMNEPASFQGELPGDIVFTDEDIPMPHRKMHNVYGHLMSSATWQGLKDATGKRPFVITRACYSGTQKYATVWTGDNMSLWAHLQMMIPQLCNLGLSGYSLCGTDIGGFGGDTTPELLTRWIEAAVFSPLFRNHSCSGTNRQEPWLFGEETLAVYRKYVELRYTLLPYLYDLCRECEETGLPVMRPLVLHYPQDPQAAECNDEFLVGENLLCAPVVTQGARQRLVFFPEGTWYGYWDGQRYEGGQSCIVEAPLDTLPLFARAGSLIPTWECVQYVGEAEPSILTLRAYPGDGSTLHYRDNGEDFAYREGEYDHYRFTQKDGQVTAVLEHYGYRHPYAEVRVEHFPEVNFA